jgi:hypothetical protein
MGNPVGPQTTREYLARMRERYERADRAAKSQLLDEVCAVTGYHRKAVIRRLRRSVVRRVGRRGRPVRYGPRVVGALRLDPLALAARIAAQLTQVYQLANHRVSSAATRPRVDAVGPVDAQTASKASVGAAWPPVRACSQNESTRPTD